MVKFCRDFKFLILGEIDPFMALAPSAPQSLLLAQEAIWKSVIVTPGGPFGGCGGDGVQDI